MGFYDHIVNGLRHYVPFGRICPTWTDLDYLVDKFLA
jgi:hypothetical protein